MGVGASSGMSPRSCYEEFQGKIKKFRDGSLGLSAFTVFMGLYRDSFEWKRMILSPDVAKELQNDLLNLVGVDIENRDDTVYELTFESSNPDVVTYLGQDVAAYLDGWELNKINSTHPNTVQKTADLRKGLKAQACLYEFTDGSFFWLISQPKQVTSLKKKSLLSFDPAKGRYVKAPSDLIELSKDVGIAVYRDTFFVFNYNTLEKSAQIREASKEAASRGLSHFSGNTAISIPALDSLSEYVGNRPSKSKRLAKAQATAVLDNLDPRRLAERIDSLSDLHGGKIWYQWNGSSLQVHYDNTDKKAASELVNILSNFYLDSNVTGHTYAAPGSHPIK